MATLKLPRSRAVSDSFTTPRMPAAKPPPRASSTFTARAVRSPSSFEPVKAIPAWDMVLRPRIPLLLMEWIRSIIAAMRSTSMTRASPSSARRDASGSLGT